MPRRTEKTKWHWAFSRRWPRAEGYAVPRKSRLERRLQSVAEARQAAARGTVILRIMAFEFIREFANSAAARARTD